MDILTKKQLKFAIASDYMMNRGFFKPTLKIKLKNIIEPDLIMRFLITMRKVNYYSNNKGLGISLIINKIRFNRLSVKLGYSIGPKVFGYGLIIPHHGTIVVGASNRIGNYSVLHTSTCISGNGKIIGDGLYLATGAKMTSKLSLGMNVSIAANSVVNKSFTENNILLVGSPAIIKNTTEPWYIRDGEIFASRVRRIEELRIKYNF